MRPEDFLTAWQDGEGESLVRYSADLVEKVPLPAATRRFLLTAGLPGSAAPFLNFGDRGVGTLHGVRASWQLPPEFDRYYEIGGDGVGSPICLDIAMACAVMVLDHDHTFQAVLLNSSIEALADCLLAYRQLVRDAQMFGGPDAFLDGRVPTTARERFVAAVRASDSVALQSGAFWGDEAVRLEQGAA